MKILYDKRQLVDAVEYVNTFNTNLTQPVHWKDVAEKIKTVYFDASLPPCYEGITFSYMMQDDVIMCFFTVDTTYEKRPHVLMEIDVTKDIEEFDKKYLKSIQDGLEEAMEELGLEGLIELDIEQDPVESNDNKKKLH